MGIEETAVPNHHAHWPGFGGLTGYVAAATMLLGRQNDARLAERLSGLGPGDSVADVGCGPGAAVRHAAKLGAFVTGIDPAPVMLKVARFLTHRADRIRFVEGSAEALPLADSSVTVLWSIASVHHWADLDKGLREARRVLAPGGRFVAIERRTRPHAKGLASHGWTDQQAAVFAGHCLASGFEGTQSGHHRHGRRTVVTVVATAGNPTTST